MRYPTGPQNRPEYQPSRRLHGHRVSLVVSVMTDGDRGPRAFGAHVLCDVWLVMSSGRICDWSDCLSCPLVVVWFTLCWSFPKIWKRERPGICFRSLLMDYGSWIWGYGCLGPIQICQKLVVKEKFKVFTEWIALIIVIAVYSIVIWM